MRKKNNRRSENTLLLQSDPGLCLTMFKIFSHSEIKKIMTFGDFPRKSFLNV